MRSIACVISWVSFPHWWTSLSGESKAAIIAAIVGPITVEILGIRMRSIQWFYIRAIEKLDFAREQIQKENTLNIRTRLGGPIDIVGSQNQSIPLDRLAKKANISLWRANRAVRWQVRRQRFGG
jgi:hypothetical protein